VGREWYDGSAHKLDEPACIAVSATQVLVTGASQSGRNPELLRCHDGSIRGGDRRRSWTATVAHDKSSDLAGSCAVARRRGLLRRGTPPNRSLWERIHDWLCRKHRDLLLWSRRYDGTRSSWESAHALSISPDGSRLYVTGVTNVRGTEDYLTLAYDSTSGVLRWRRIHIERFYEYPFGLAVAPDGKTLLVSGSAGSKFLTSRIRRTASSSGTGRSTRPARLVSDRLRSRPMDRLPTSRDGMKTMRPQSPTKWPPVGRCGRGMIRLWSPTQSCRSPQGGLYTSRGRPRRPWTILLRRLRCESRPSDRG
jgi:hypothetical protein